MQCRWSGSTTKRFTRSSLKAVHWTVFRALLTLDREGPFGAGVAEGLPKTLHLCDQQP